MVFGGKVYKETFERNGNKHMSAMILSVIIPMYNAEKTIERCVFSVTKQNKSDVEIILVDDGSIDDTLNIAKHLCSETNAIRIYQQNHKGVSAARNLGLNKALGEWVAFLDADDELESNALKVFIDAIETEVEAVCGKVSRGNHKSIDGGCEHFFSESEKDDLLNYALSEPTDRLTCHAWFFKKSICYENNIEFSLNLSIGEDSDWVLRYLSVCRAVKFINYTLYKMIVTSTSSTNTWKNNQIERYQEMLTAIGKTDISQKEQWPVFVLVTFLLILTHVIFHPSNPKKWKDKKRKAKEIRDSEPFIMAFSDANYRTISPGKRITLICARQNYWYLVYIAVKIRQLQNKKFGLAQMN